MLGGRDSAKFCRSGWMEQQMPSGSICAQIHGSAEAHYTLTLIQVRDRTSDRHAVDNAPLTIKFALGLIASC